MQRIRIKTAGAYPVASTYFDVDGEPIALSAAGQVTVHDGAGVETFTGTATLSGGQPSVSLPLAALPRLDRYVISWAGTVAGQPVAWSDSVELVGGFIFEIAQLRAFDRAFENVEKYPSALLHEIRSQVEDVIEGPRAANVAFVPRGRRITTGGSARLATGGQYAIRLPDFELRTAYAVTADGTAFTNDEINRLIADDNLLWRTRPWPEGHRNIAIHYAHGLDSVPGAITRAALILAREHLVRSDLPARATATSIGDQMFRLTIAGRDGVTGIPDVDAAIDQFGRKEYLIG